MTWRGARLQMLDGAALLLALLSHIMLGVLSSAVAPYARCGIKRPEVTWRGVVLARLTGLHCP